MMNKLLIFISLNSVALLFVGCQNGNLYYWANYEPLIYSSYANPGEIQPLEQIEILKKDILDAQNKGKPLPPGFYSHLGYLYFQAGDLDSATLSFQTEKELYPESTVFMNRLIERMKNK